MLTPAQILAECGRIINGRFLGMMTTIDHHGMPHARWMGSAITANGIRTIYTLTGATTRKVTHIRTNPAVCWVFSSDELGDIATCYGTAEVMTSPAVAQAVWDRLMECARNYVMGPLSDESNQTFVTIETTVQRVELLSPRRKIYRPLLCELDDVPSRYVSR